MMYTQLSLKDLVKAVRARIEAGSGLRCYDVVPADETPPYCYVQVTRTAPADTKTMYCKSYDVWVHVISDETASHVPIYTYVEAVQEAMTQEIELPEPFYLVTQIDTGLQTLQTEETGSSHAIIGFSFKISYGYKVKI